MTQSPTPQPASTPPGPEAAKVAELEKRLAEAAAEVARIQAELSQARAADPATPEVQVPYSGQAPVVMINGQPVPTGQVVDISAMLGSFFGGAGAGVTTNMAGTTQVTIPPVVSVNGQVVSGGQPVDLTTYVGPEIAAQIRKTISDVGLDARIGHLFGGPPPPQHQAAPQALNTAAEHPGAVAEPSPSRRVLTWVGLACFVLLAVLVFLVVAEALGS